MRSTFCRGKGTALMAVSVTGHDYLLSLKEQKDRRADYYETLYMDLLERKARASGVPLNGQYELTPLCNFDCGMCYTHLTREQMLGKPLLDVAQWKHLTDQAFKAGLMRVNLTGGECLTYPGFEELYLYLHSLGIEIRVLTNGALLDNRWIRFFEAHPPIMIQISLYGGDEETYERVTGQRMFSVVSSNIRSLIDADLPVTLAVTPSRFMGLSGALGTVHAAHDFGIPFGIVSHLSDPKAATGRSGQQLELTLDDYVEILRYRNRLDGIVNDETGPDQLPVPGGPHHTGGRCGLNCGGGLSSFNINWDGTMTICTDSHDVVTEPLKEGFDACWNKIHRIAAGWHRPPECMDCPYEDICQNCELLKAAIAGGAGKQPLALCERTRYLVQHGVYTLPVCK